MGLAADEVPVTPAEVEAQLAYVNGAAMLVRRDLLERVGLMDERYFLYSEEHDWAHRSQQAGFRLGWVPQALVFHKHGATIGTASSGGSPLSLFYLYRNKLAFARRHHPWRLWSVVPMLTWEICKFVLKGHPEKAKAAWRGLLAERPHAFLHPMTLTDKPLKGHRLVVLAPDIPWPANRGGRADVWRRIQALRAQGAAVFLIHLHEPSGPLQPTEAHWQHLKQNVDGHDCFPMQARTLSDPEAACKRL